MGSHIASIGIHSRKELQHYLKIGLEMAAGSEHVDADTGTSYWLPNSSAGLWVHVDAACFVPTHQAQSSIKFRPIHWIENDDHCPYCAMLGIEVLNHEETVLYPLPVTFGNTAKARQEIVLGDSVELAITAFVESGQSWKNIAAFEAEQEAGNLIGPGWVFPFGPYSALDSQRTNSPRAALYGVVETLSHHRNSVTGHQYRSAQLQCGPYQYSSVMADDTLPELAVGHVVYVECWMCVAN
ncbi:MAG: hypothetical protein NPIRA02_02580 [Nitrospirales bacterium]|nr:MAG: hypothetical protein NPIRA02_02580 [Nitrospirales bacterium]